MHKLSSSFVFILRTPEGLEDTSKYPNLFAALLEDKKVYWSQQDLAKLASGNLIRVFKEVRGSVSMGSMSSILTISFKNWVFKLTNSCREKKKRFNFLRIITIYNVFHKGVKV